MSERNRWTPEEDRALSEAALSTTSAKKDWVKIAERIPNRSAKQCRERWRNHVRPGICKGLWTQDEDLIILRGVKQYGFKWAVIARQLPGRTGSLVKNRYHQTLRSTQQSEDCGHSASLSGCEQSSNDALLEPSDSDSSSNSETKPEPDTPVNQSPPRLCHSESSLDRISISSLCD
eukprot:c6037_g1_i2.p1 GENE.c6037_g1_i2~~c6037_g1_i2.p1  ORF type:complete len:176 (+),score=8.15 c6037_g1_i2:77-604(+)